MLCVCVFGLKPYNKAVFSSRSLSARAIFFFTPYTTPYILYRRCVAFLYFTLYYRTPSRYKEESRSKSSESERKTLQSEDTQHRTTSNPARASPQASVHASQPLLSQQTILIRGRPTSGHQPQPLLVRSCVTAIASGAPPTTSVCAAA
jgi:hypothetical protein